MAKHLRLIHSKHQPRQRRHPQSAKVACAHCHTMIPANSIRCPHCGLHFKNGKAYEFAKSANRQPQQPKPPGYKVWQTERGRLLLLLSCLFTIALLVTLISH